jgi:hypothetical protein
MAKIPTKDTNTGLPSLSDEEKLKIEAEVAEELEIEAKEKAEDDYRAKAKKDAKRKALLRDAKPGDPDADGLVPVYLTLPTGATECVRLDGAAYYPNKTHYVTPAVRAVLLDCMARGQEHEDTLNGKTSKENINRRRNNTIARV